MTAEEQFKRDFIIKILVQETQFEQWLQVFFLLNHELENEYNSIYQDSLYIKFNELINEGYRYAQKLLNHLTNSANVQKRDWYSKLLTGLSDLKSALTETELDYIEYRRHNTCHIFQDTYEIIQHDLKIKKVRKDKSLPDLQNKLMTLIATHGSDRNVDEYIMTKLKPVIRNLYLQLK